MIGFNLRSRPEDRLLGRRVKSFGVEQSTAIVIAQDAEVEAGNNIQAFLRLGTIANDVAQTDDPVDGLRLYMLKHTLQCRQIAMNVAENCRSGHFAIDP